MKHIRITTLLSAAAITTLTFTATAGDAAKTKKDMAELKDYFLEQRNDLLEMMVDQWLDDSVKVAEIDKHVTDLMRYEMNLVERPDVTLYTGALKKVENAEERVHVIIARVLAEKGITLNPAAYTDDIKWKEVTPPAEQ